MTVPIFATLNARARTNSPPSLTTIDYSLDSSSLNGFPIWTLIVAAGVLRIVGDQDSVASRARVAATPWRLNPIPLPDSVFKWLHEHKTPPPGASVWIGTTSPGPNRRPDQRWQYGNVANHLITLPDNDGPIGNIITFHIQFLMFKVCVVQIKGTNPEPIRVPQPDPHFLQIWPIRSDTVHGPALGLSWTDFDTLLAQLWPVPVPPDAPPMKPWPLIPKESADWR